MREPKQQVVIHPHQDVSLIILGVLFLYIEPEVPAKTLQGSTRPLTFHQRGPHQGPVWDRFKDYHRPFHRQQPLEPWHCNRAQRANGRRRGRGSFCRKHGEQTSNALRSARLAARFKSRPWRWGTKATLRSAGVIGAGGIFPASLKRDWSVQRVHGKRC